MAPAGIALRDGSGRGVEAPRHPDQLVEAMRWAATEGRMVQLADRARGVRRGPEAPLDVWLLSPLPLPGMPADRLLAWAGVEVSRLALAFWRLGGVLPLRPLDLVRTGLWATEKAADRALEEAGVRQDPPAPLGDDLLKAAGGLEGARYRRPGQSVWSKALVDPALPAALLVELLRAATGEPRLIVEGAPPPDPRVAACGRAAGAVVIAAAPVAAGGKARVAALGDDASQAAQLRAALPTASWRVPPRPPRAFSCASASRPGLDPAWVRFLTSEKGAAWVRAELRSRGLTLTALAALSGVSRPHLSNALAGRFGLSPVAVSRLSQAIGALPPRPRLLL